MVYNDKKSMSRLMKFVNKFNCFYLSGADWLTQFAPPRDRSIAAGATRRAQQSTIISAESIISWAVMRIPGSLLQAAGIHIIAPETPV
ncbi:hypothetical protein G5I_05917 [Acromyrmex echinatior]|uniref:Uncharacterized protein n=1 Tax=Acromyrmex echinatior TaxID=103372 RepID=F4WJN6_ACREC|nr:hypothetical protein G5I_05917 [Acromyrmex echinatior]